MSGHSPLLLESSVSVSNINSFGTVINCVLGFIFNQFFSSRTNKSDKVWACMLVTCSLRKEHRRR